MLGQMQTIGIEQHSNLLDGNNQVNVERYFKGIKKVAFQSIS